MVGATHYVASLENSENLKDPKAYAQLLNDASRDALTKTFGALVINDILGAIPRRIIGRDNLPELFFKDRGLVLEDEWIRNTMRDGKPSVFGRKLSDLADEKSLDLSDTGGWRPVLLFAPAIAEDGRRLIVCNQRIDSQISQQVNSMQPVKREKAQYEKDEEQTLVPQQLLSIDSIHLRDLDEVGHQNITLATAARLNANFPFVVSSPELANPTDAASRKPPFHIMDGGYYDNYGVNLAARWLHKHADKITSRYSGVLFIQISSTDRNRRSVSGIEGSNFPETSYINYGFQKTTFLTDFQIHELSSKTFGGRTISKPNAKDSKTLDVFPYFAFCSLNFEGPVSLNWSLTASELYALLSPYMKSRSTLEDPPFPEDFAFDDAPTALKDDLRSGRKIFETWWDHNKKGSPGNVGLDLAKTISDTKDNFEKMKLWWDAAQTKADKSP